MEIELVLALGMFLCAILALLAGYPVALTLGGVALIFGFIGVELGLIPLPILRNLPSRILGSMENQVLIAVPLFVLMGVILERSRVADDLLQTA
ncbi:MAG: TRAP transporter large permease subunit, partial [Pseudomonadota bacterium]